MMASPDLQEGDLKSGRSVLLQSEKYTRSLDLIAVRRIRGEWLLTFWDCHTIAEAYRLIGYEVWSPEEASPRPVDEGPLHYAVVDDRGKAWGVVVAVWSESLSPTLEIEHEGRQILVPWHPEIVLEIDDAKHLVVISPPRGLMDLNS